MGRMGQQLIKSSNKNKNFKLVSLTENFKINKKINNILPEFNNINSFIISSPKRLGLSVIRC